VSVFVCFGDSKGAHTSASAYTNTNTIAACPWQHEARENVEAEENARNGSKHFLFSLFCLLFSMVPTVSRSKIVMWSSAGDDD